MNTEASQGPDLREIVSRLGGDLLQGGNAAVIPGPGHSQNDRSLSLRRSGDGSRVLWFSHAGDDASTVWRYLGLPNSTQGRELSPRELERQRKARQDAQRADTARKLAFCRLVWEGTQPAAGTPVETYLRGRGIMGPIPPALRFHPAAPLAYPTKERPDPPTRPGMVAIATAADGKSAAGLHVTALRADGSGKAPMSNARRMFGELAGAVVQLAPFPAGGELAIAEGIETALSYRDLTGSPTWAGLSTAGLSRFTPPAGLQRLVIAADGDDAGLKAARDLAERASRRCEAVVMPAPDGTDWNDAVNRSLTRER